MSPLLGNLEKEIPSYVGKRGKEKQYYSLLWMCTSRCTIALVYFHMKLFSTSTYYEVDVVINVGLGWRILLLSPNPKGLLPTLARSSAIKGKQINKDL